MRMLLPLGGTLLSALADPAHAQQMKQFKDWLVACDNRRSCSAFGFEAQDNPAGAYVRIDRAGEPDAIPTVRFAFDVPDGVHDARVRLSMAGQASGGAPSGPLAAAGGEAPLAPAQAGAFVAALNTGRTLAVSVLDGTRPVDRRQISLSGATAALRFVDAVQRRAGTVTAFVARGPAAASTIPTPPALLRIAAQPISQITPLPRAPAGVQPSKDCLDSPGADSALVAFRLSPTQTLWGACEDWGAYNANYRMFLADGQTVTRPAINGFDVPGQPMRPGTAGLLSFPTLADDHRTLTAVTKDEGLGDCGIASDWVWDGHTVRLANLRAMPLCRGVDSSHWPTLFATTRQ